VCLAAGCRALVGQAFTWRPLLLVQQQHCCKCMVVALVPGGFELERDKQDSVTSFLGWPRLLPACGAREHAPFATGLRNWGTGNGSSH